MAMDIGIKGNGRVNMVRGVIGALLSTAALLPGIAAAQDDRAEQQSGQHISRRGEMREMREAVRRDEGAAPAQVQQQPQFQQRDERPADRGEDRRAPRQDAQERRDDGGRNQAFQQQQRQQQQNRDDRPAFARDDRPGPVSPQGRRDGYDQRRSDAGGYRDDRRDIGQNRGDDRRDRGFADGGRVGDRGWNGGGAGYAGNGGRSWDRQWRGDNRYDYGRFRQQNRGSFRLPRYYAPQGWGYGYRRFSVGFSLSSVLWGRNYWIDDPYAYRLPPAYGPYRWVRYYNDALLVDIRSGYIVDTVYDIFW